MISPTAGNVSHTDRPHLANSAPMTSPNTTCTLRSMTGQGHAELQDALGTVTVEVRTVNHRGFKCSPRTSESLAWLESRIEKIARSMIRRGAVYLTVNWQRPPGQGLPSIDTAALENYYRQLTRVRDTIGEAAKIDLTALVDLPGVVVPAPENWRDHEELWAIVERAVCDAIENLNAMRRAEGAAMIQTLVRECAAIRGHLDSVCRLAPRTIDLYRNRLESKIRRVLEEHRLEIPTFDLLREVQIYADRSDVSEELTRLDSHLQMFHGILQGNGNADPEPSGRKLDFVTQEMFRETNTIGSKASDAEVSSHVVEIKCAIERMRELVQNLE